LVDPEAREPVNTAPAQMMTTEKDGEEEKACWIYAWSAPLDRLEPRIWKYVFNSFHLPFLFTFNPLPEM